MEREIPNLFLCPSHRLLGSPTSHFSVKGHSPPCTALPFCLHHLLLHFARFLPFIGCPYLLPHPRLHWGPCLHLPSVSFSCGARDKPHTHLSLSIKVNLESAERNLSLGL